MRPISVLNLFRKGGLCTFVIAVCVALAGCQTMQTRSSMETRYIDAADPCRPVRSQLIQSQSQLSANLWKWALAGAVVTIVEGVLKGRDREDILKRAIIGGLTGAAAGYLKGKLEQAESREELRDAINSDVQHETHKVTEMGTILHNLNECRRNQVVTARRDFDDGSVTAQATKAVLQTVRASVQGDNMLIEEILGEVTKRKGVYVAGIGRVENKAEEVILADAAASTSETAADPEAVADVRELDRASRQVRDEYELASADLFREIEELEELTLV